MPSSDRLPSPPLAIAAVLLFSKNPDALAGFYRQKIGVPLQRIAVPELPAHWACDIGHVYVSIWPTDAADCERAQPHRGGIAFYVRNVATEFARLKEDGVSVDFAPKRTGVGIIARLRDPDGNPFELYQPAR